jgi:hypothetical protein
MSLPGTVRELLETLARVGPSLWIDATCAVLDGSGETHEAFAHLIEGRRERVASGQVERSVGRMGIEDSVLAYAASVNLDEDFVRAYGTLMKYHMRVQKIVVIGQSTATPDRVTVYVEDGAWVEEEAVEKILPRFLKELNSQDVQLRPTAGVRGEPGRASGRA